MWRQKEVGELRTTRVTQIWLDCLFEKTPIVAPKIRTVGWEMHFNIPHSNHGLQLSHLKPRWKNFLFYSHPRATNNTTSFLTLIWIAFILCAFQHSVSFQEYPCCFFASRQILVWACHAAFGQWRLLLKLDIGDSSHLYSMYDPHKGAKFSSVITVFTLNVSAEIRSYAV
jgi:hypothetical protein